MLYGVVYVLVGELLDVGIWVIDLFVDFCLVDVEEWVCWYGQLYGVLVLFDEVVYGLLEVNCEKICQVCLIVVLGCYLIVI